MANDEGYRIPRDDDTRDALFHFSHFTRQEKEDTRVSGTHAWPRLTSNGAAEPREFKMNTTFAYAQRDQRHRLIGWFATSEMRTEAPNIVCWFERVFDGEPRESKKSILAPAKCLPFSRCNAYGLRPYHLRRELPREAETSRELIADEYIFLLHYRHFRRVGDYTLPPRWLPFL